ncbi:hypothetical protein RUM43_002439 [Polyplax serrata]|uniref:Uncharacterized protein n=1 Tax=Polyplax serrata TaxID=468196 RepID=A0AAN8NYU1_POLSC
MDGGYYIPNNPAHYGLPDSGPTSGIYNTQCWSAEDMGSFSLSPLDLDQFFPFSPPTSYKSEFPMVKERVSNGGDMTDVLLSLKHPVVHPGQLSPNAFTCHGSPQYQGTPASLSYSVHPQMLSMSPGGGCGPQYCLGSMDQTNMFNGIPGGGSSQHNVFPSMSVNVSMNMTMHGYPGSMNTDNIHTQMSCPQVSKTKNFLNRRKKLQKTRRL